MYIYIYDIYIYEQEHAWSKTERRAADAGTKEVCTVKGGWERELLGK
jgi:hypothetical protein